jgi:hypothetical protein
MSLLDLHTLFQDIGIRISKEVRKEGRKEGRTDGRTERRTEFGIGRGGGEREKRRKVMERWGW